MADEPGNVFFEVRVTEETVGGVYANYLAAWYTAYEFTLDFGVTQPPELRPDEDGNNSTVVPVHVVARVKVPPTLIFNVIRALNDNMTSYEQAFGEIKRPGEEDVALPLDLRIGEQPADEDDTGIEGEGGDDER